MNTVVVVSGILRQLVNASSSWFLNADYHLIVQNDILEPQSPKSTDANATNVLDDVISQCNIQFSSISIVNDMPLPFSDLKDNYLEIKKHPAINMAYKWKIAYHLLSAIQPIKKYERIFILRPDLYISPKVMQDFKANFDSIKPFKNHYHVAGEQWTTANGKTATSDLFIMLDWDTFGIISLFFDYYIENYDNEYQEVHVMLTNFLRDNNIKFEGSILTQYISLIVLRDNTVDMFKNGKLEDQYDIGNLFSRNKEWWKERFKNV